MSIVNEIISVKILVAIILSLHEGGDPIDDIEDRYFRGQAELLSRTLEALNLYISEDVLFPILLDAINDVAEGEDMVRVINRLWNSIIAAQATGRETIDTHR